MFNLFLERLGTKCRELAERLELPDRMGLDC